ncbi:uncharacterized protein CIMG_10624 [Coccidioides immitis RS]|uniref:Uncharacterized protein n=3 Tax=Coccidioides immitis TaxID=5501 RepID=A0A0D8JSK2_COCIM|nr:uncharacterized protein CIMG_10624 [Coccidioides immitis RS]KJF60262.1 hypothetical protein CIMG_10624 [Coccidioides immitis RS]KMP00721.1 hypothetical protein CIRG_00863 [Coccidioides immitis RMSCC 2394]KMU85385.1 hypothetical protein CIHG_03167 [Coccidioides immitis H538.4]
MAALVPFTEFFPLSSMNAGIEECLLTMGNVFMRFGRTILDVGSLRRQVEYMGRCIYSLFSLATGIAILPLSPYRCFEIALPLYEHNNEMALHTAFESQDVVSGTYSEPLGMRPGLHQGHRYGLWVERGMTQSLHIAPEQFSH